MRKCSIDVDMLIRNFDTSSFNSRPLAFFVSVCARARATMHHMLTQLKFYITANAWHALMFVIIFSRKEIKTPAFCIQIVERNQIDVDFIGTLPKKWGSRFSTLCIYFQIWHTQFSYFSTKTYIVGTQKNRLN